MTKESSPAGSRTFRILLVEDHPMFRAQLAHLITKEPDMCVCGDADNTRDAMALIESMGPDIVLLDITLKGQNGLELLKDLKVREISVPCLVVSMHDELLYAERVLRAGGRGYITKHETATELMLAVRQVLNGEIYLGKQMTSRVFENLTAGPQTQTGVSALTDRELEVFELIGHGRTTRQISSQLHVGVSTVDTYRARIKAKLNLDNSSQLNHEAICWVSEGHKTTA
jgi:DNA-binding NarL/FixJ family response regulator